VHDILKTTSENLEALLPTASIHSFILAVDPNDTSDEGFLGGTLTGREFWRGLRGGGSIGAKAFKSHCLRNTASAPPAVPKRTTASTIKADVYTGFRDALRFVNTHKP
jgi:hypothetical protein